MERADDIAQAVIARLGPAACKRVERARLGRLFNQMAVQIDHQRAAARRHRPRA